MIDTEKLGRLARTWEERSRRKLECGAQAEDGMGRRMVEHGAMCYFNCAQELREALGQDPCGASGVGHGT